MMKHVARTHGSVEVLDMRDQVLRAPFTDAMAPGLAHRAVPVAARSVLFGLPLTFSAIVLAVLVAAFRSDGQVTVSEAMLIAMMALLSGWEALSTANAVLGFKMARTTLDGKQKSSLTIAILTTIRDEIADDVIPEKLGLLRSLQSSSPHRFSLHVLSDSTSIAHIVDERRIVGAALPLPVFYNNRPLNTDFKSGNIRNWVEKHGFAYDAFIILDADSELDRTTALLLANSLSSDPACGLIQTVPVVRAGNTYWQYMQSVASRLYGGLQGQGLSSWMGDEANYYGHNAIIRTRAFAASAGLPHLKGQGLWNGTILSHDFVEAALLRRAGWASRLLTTESGSYEEAPADVISHLKRDARWCLGNFQHSRILGSAGLHPISRFHLLSGVFNYLSSAVWLATLVLWGALDLTQTGVGGALTTAAFFLIVINLLLPRLLGVVHATARSPAHFWSIAKDALKETLFSSLIAPSLMLQRVMIIVRVLTNRRVVWAPHEKSDRSLPDTCIFHTVEVLVGLGLLACVERGYLTLWFLPLAVSFALTPVLSWISAWPTNAGSHENLNASTRL
jgi:membrane glycosyltransferase